MAEAPLQTSRRRSLAQFFERVAPECLAARRDEFIADVIAGRRRYRAIEIIDGFRGPEHDSLPNDYWRMGEIAWYWSTLTFEMRSFFIEVLVEEAPPLPIDPLFTLSATKPPGIPKVTWSLMCGLVEIRNADPVRFGALSLSERQESLRQRLGRKQVGLRTMQRAEARLEKLPGWTK